MTLTLERPPVDLGSGDGGVPARRAVVRWARRLFLREWRQQLLVLALVTVAVAIMVVGAGVAVNTPTPSKTGFGTADAMVQLPASDPKLASIIAALEHRVGAVDVIDNLSLPVPGSIATYDLRSQNPEGTYGKAAVSLVSGRYPASADEVAITSGVASAFGLHVGSVWYDAGVTRHVVGIVQNPQNLLDEFALVPQGQVGATGQVTLLFDASAGQVASLGLNVQTPPNTLNGGFNPEIFVILIATVGMLLIGMVAVGGFTVLAQRRMRSIGMLGALGATDRNIRLVVRANGVVVGVVGTVFGGALGLLAWLIYRPHVEQASHHLIGTFQLPWVVILPAMALAIVTTWLAASRPARAVTRVPVVTALSGRPAPPRQLHRSAVPGVAVIVFGYVLLLYAGQTKGNGGGAPELVFGFVALTVGIILLAPLAITSVAGLARPTPLAVRMALRDLARYRARSGSALGAIGLGVLIAATVCVAAAGRYGNVLDYAGPNLANNELNVYTPQAPPPGAVIISPNGVSKAGPKANTPQPSNAALLAKTNAIAAALGSHKVVELLTPDVSLVHEGAGRNFSGQLYVATPQLLRAFGISASDVDPNADILTMRPGLESISNMDMFYGPASGGSGPGANNGPNGQAGSSVSPCPVGQCVADPPMQTIGALPSGTSGPNTVVTEHAVHRLGLQTSLAGWMILTDHPLTVTQINTARLTASTLGMTVESKSDSPSSTQVIDWATVVGILLALAILAMTVGLIRSETASDLRTLTATGASSATRRTITAATAGALALIGAVMGTAAAYLACLAFFSGAPNGDGISELSNIPLANLAIILVGMPLLAAVGGWLFAGRQPAFIAQKPLE